MAWTAPRTWVAGETVTASIGNTHWRDNLKAIGDAWTAFGSGSSWTSTGTAPALGNGTWAGGYIQPGKLTIFRIKITMGSTTTYGTGGYRVALPATILSGYPARFTVGVFDTSASAHYHGVTYDVSGTTCNLAIDNGTAGGALAAVQPTVPFTFATGDTIEVTGMYEAA